MVFCSKQTRRIKAGRCAGKRPAAGRRRLEGSATVETAVVMSAALLCIMLIMFAGLYFHDKCLLAGAAHESAQAAGERERMREGPRAGEYFNNRIAGKLLYFSSASCRESLAGDALSVEAGASSGRMSVKVSASAACPVPEEEIRKQQ